MTPVQLALVEEPQPRQMAPASLEQWDRLKDSLPMKRLLALRLLCAAMASQEDVTGGELAERAGWNLLTMRTRLTELHKARLITRTEHVRPSRAKSPAIFETTAHGYSTDLPLAAVERAIDTLKVTHGQKKST